MSVTVWSQGPWLGGVHKFEGTFWHRILPLRIPYAVGPSGKRAQRLAYRQWQAGNSVFAY